MNLRRMKTFTSILGDIKMSQRVEVVIAKDGNVDMHVIGIKGSGCQDLTRNLEHLLGDNVVREDTLELYETGQQQHEQVYAD